MRVSMARSLFLSVVSILLFACTKGTDNVENKLFSLPAEDNVVFVVVDTLRADHLSFYGYPKETAPFLAKVAERSVIFEKAFAACSSTAPAMASIFTSLLPSEHGVISGLITTKNISDKFGQITTNRIPESLLTIPELFAGHGFKTFGVADNLNISDDLGFTQGFSKFKVFRYDGAPQINKVVTEWETEIKSSGRHFMYLHYMDPHAPYHRRAPWYQKGETKRQNVINAYDSEISFADKHIEELFTKFGWLDNALVIFLSDHGEEFWDHGDKGHDKTLYREVIHVPLFIYHRSLQARRVSEPVHTYDMLPTLNSILNAAADSKWRGMNLHPYLTAGLPAPRPLVSELLRRAEHSRDARRSVVHQDMHYIRTFRDGQGVKDEQVFNLKTDLPELNDLAKTMPERTAELSKVLDKTLESGSSYKEEVDIEMDPEGLDHLRSLGYVD